MVLEFNFGCLGVGLRNGEYRGLNDKASLVSSNIQSRIAAEQSGNGYSVHTVCPYPKALHPKALHPKTLHPKP